MRVILEDGLSLRQPTGIGRYTLDLGELLRGAGPKLDTDLHVHIHLPRRRFLRRLPRGAPRRAAYAAWLATGFQLEVRCCGADLVHFTNYMLPPRNWSRARWLVTIHDLAAFRVPGTLPAWYGRYLRRAIAQAVEYADRVIAVSASVRDELLARFGANLHDVRVVPNALTGTFLKPAPTGYRGKDGRRVAIYSRGRRPPYLLHVGTLERRKNLTVLIDAFDHLCRIQPDAELELVLAGQPGFGADEIGARIQASPFRSRILTAGYVPQKKLLRLYAEATLLVLPSLYEGFGRPLIEAMAQRTACVVSDIPAHREVAGEAAAFYSPVENAEALLEVCTPLLADAEARAELTRRGMAQIERFRPEVVRPQLLAAYLDPDTG